MMQSKPEYFRTCLTEELARRQRANPAYSLRSFARHLGMQPPTLSAVLAGKRPLPAAAAETLPEKLSFSPAEKKRFLNSVYYRKAAPETARAVEDSAAAKILREEIHFKIIAEWEHYAILTLAEAQGFKADKTWIAKRMGISEARAQATLDRLKEAGLISVDSIGRTRLQQVHVKTGQEESTSAALRLSHREALQMGLEKLENTPIQLRDFTSMTVAVSMDRIEEAKKLVRVFQKDIAKLLESGKRTEVYQICVQLYPVTQVQTATGARKNEK